MQPSTNITAATVITRLEVLRGRIEFALKAADRADTRRALEWIVRSEFLPTQITIIPFDATAAIEFDRLCQNRKLKKIGRADMLIAGIALARRATLATRNLRHFEQVPGLRLENWAD
jgi:tRNA(fMet)-specific endonuclease VapC